MADAAVPEKQKLTAPHLLLCEGEQERRFFKGILDGKLSPQIQYFPYQGKAKIGDYLKSLVATVGFSQVRWLGIVTDADDDAAGAFQRVATALRSAGLPAPSQSWQAQTAGGQTVVVFVLPDGHSPGDLESLLWEYIHTQPLGQCIEAFLNCAQAARSPRQVSKARVAAWLATQERPDWRLGEAAQAGCCNFVWQITQFNNLLALIPPSPQPQPER